MKSGSYSCALQMSRVRYVNGPVTVRPLPTPLEIDSRFKEIFVPVIHSSPVYYSIFNCIRTLLSMGFVFFLM